MVEGLCLSVWKLLQSCGGLTYRLRTHAYTYAYFFYLTFFVITQFSSVDYLIE